jgi:DnaK suppressor protein
LFRRDIFFDEVYLKKVLNLKKESRHKSENAQKVAKHPMDRQLLHRPMTRRYRMSDFSEKFITQQKSTLLELKQQIMNKLAEKPEGIDESKDEMKEEGDHAAILLSQQMSFNLRDREVKRLKEVNAALYRIAEGVYGYCEESGEVIETKRLENQPWARLSIYYAEQLEREQGRQFSRA